MAQALIIIGDDLNGVTQGFEAFNHLIFKPRLQFERCALFGPGFTKQPPGRSNGALRVVPIPNVATKNCGLCLWLTFASHCAVDQQTTIGELCHGGIERVKGLSTRCETSELMGPEVKGATSVLPPNACIGKNHTAAKLKVNALNHAHSTSLIINDAKPGGVAIAFRRGPGAGLMDVNGLRQLKDQFF